MTKDPAASAAAVPPPPQTASSSASSSSHPATAKDRLHDNLRVFIRCRPVLPTDKTAVTDHSTFNLVRILENKLVVVLDPERVWRENGLEYHSAGGAGGSGMDDHHQHQKILSKHHQNDVLRANRSREKRYAFDCAFDGSTTQDDVFEKCVEPLLDSVLDGFNASCFAYGQTGSGKTYTMLGPEESPGIMFRALQGIFNRIGSFSEDHSFRVILSYLEVYNENIRDLLQPSDEYLELREDNDRMHVVGLTEIEVKNIKETMSLLRRGNQNRIQEETAHNKESSRSHAVLQITVEKRNRIKNVAEQVQVGKLSLIDLAGSERAAVSNNRGIRLREGANINRSLLALGNCINALGHRNSKGGYIPYRDSKLTRLLKDSLGGNCRTSMVSCISPTNYEDTINTLKYANRAKNIKMTVTRNVTNVNHHIVHYTNIIGELRSEISNLKQKLVATNKQLSFQKRQASQANLTALMNKQQSGGAGSATESDSEFDKLTQELVVNFEEMMQARKSVAELEALELANKIQINKLQLELANTRETISKSPVARRNTFLEMSVTKRRKEIEDLVQNMRRNSRMKAEFQEKYEQLELLAITLKEKLKQSAADNRHKQEWLTQLFRLHLLELQNTELHSFQSKQQDLLREKDLVLKNLRAQLLIRDNVIQKQREELTQFTAVDYDLPPNYIDASEFAGLTGYFENGLVDDHDAHSSVPNSRGATSDDGSLGSITTSQSPLLKNGGHVYNHIGTGGILQNHPLKDNSNVIVDHHVADNTISDLVRVSSRTGSSGVGSVQSRLSEKSSTPSPKRKKAFMYKKAPFSTPPPQRRYSQQPFATSVSSTPQRREQDNQIFKKAKTKTTNKRIHRRRANRQKLLSKIYGNSPSQGTGKKSPRKKRRQKSPGQELFTRKNGAVEGSMHGNEHEVVDAAGGGTSLESGTVGSRIDLQQARLRKQRMRQNQVSRPKTLASSFHSDDLGEVVPERSDSPDQYTKYPGKPGAGVSSSLDSDLNGKDSSISQLANEAAIAVYSGLTELRASFQEEIEII
eukprot:CAMPEP_0117437702 /NCGR_PEP_ID=MMETSP0759-20121206/1667_1 /TAXON_ID=63605 /ORGANISM="Percolomonas cosmopolitus, Strain WS" /LENGTH=1033 /DNA_ID=CAMNT_0005229357 /DNA_START=373 /DNA_END=3470 /DNA_ORIENTATION=-